MIRFKLKFEKLFKNITQNKSTRCQKVANKLTVNQINNFRKKMINKIKHKSYATENWSDKFVETNVKIKKYVQMKKRSLLLLSKWIISYIIFV